MAEIKQYVVESSLLKFHRGLEKSCNKMHDKGYHLVSATSHDDYMYLFFEKNA